MVGVVDVVGDIFVYQMFFFVLYFLYLFWFGNQIVVNGDKIGIVVGEDIFGYLWSVNIVGDDCGFMEFIVYCVGEIVFLVIFQ